MEAVDYINREHGKGAIGLAAGDVRAGQHGRAQRRRMI
ncbi:DUF4113 domain-containing protein [Salinibacter ruber]